MSRREFEGALESLPFDVTSTSEATLEPRSLEALWIHYQELLRWNPRLSLVGPGTAGEIVARHYGESLAALPSLPAEASVLDVGSGGGFPGFVLAAARPGLDVTLVEPRQRKWSFLKTVIRKVKSAGIALSCRALDARVSSSLPASPPFPEQIDIVTSRALALGPERLDALAQKYPGVRFLLWISDARGGDDCQPPERPARTRLDQAPQPAEPPDSSGAGELPAIPPAYFVAGRSHLQGSRHRFIVDLRTRKENEGMQDGP